ncbi:hypothetical protein UlMin_043860 [Ulmus minor]
MLLELQLWRELNRIHIWVCVQLLYKNELQMYAQKRNLTLVSGKALLVQVASRDSSFYENLLQEMVQKEGLRLPIYDTNKSGERHCLTSIATMEIEGEYFAGEVAKTKKQEEINAARVAYKALMECKSNQTPFILSTSQRGLQGPDGLPLSLTSNVSSYLQHHVRNCFLLDGTLSPLITFNWVGERYEEVLIVDSMFS